MSGWWWGVMVGRMLSCSIVMEHMPKPQQKLRRTLHFSVWVVVGSVFFVSLSLENLEQQNSSVFLGSIIMESCFHEKARFPKSRLSTYLV